MIVLKSKQIIYFDVDDTLVKWGEGSNPDSIPITCPASKSYIDDNEVDICEWTEYLVPHKQHIDKLKKYKAKGNTIVVWSQAGADWAEAVVKALKLENYVDLCLTKPTMYYDDLPCTAWMGERRFIDE